MGPFILHIDDCPELPGGAAEALRADGYQLQHTADPEEAMRLVEERIPVLVLMELELEGCDGLDLMAGIRDPQFGSVPVLVITRVPRDTAVHGEAIALGVADFLTKPVRAKELRAAIHEIAPPPERDAQEAAPAAGGLSGELADTPMPELLARLRRRGANGVLTAGHAGIRVSVQLRNGSPVGVSSNRRESVAEVLLYETFRWEEGRFGFSEQGWLESEAMLELAGDPAGLLLAGVLDASSARQVRDRLAKRESLYVSITEESESALKAEGVGFSRRQRKLLESLGGADTLSVLLESQVFDERLVYALWVGGWLELRTTPMLTLTELLVDVAELEPELEPAPALEDREPELVELRRTREERERELEELARAREEREHALEELAPALDERAQELEELGRAREEREQELEELGQTREEREQELEELGQAREKRAQELEELGQTREERQQELEELGQTREEREQELEELGRARAERQQELEELGRAREERARELEELTRAREERARELKELSPPSDEPEPELDESGLNLDATALGEPELDELGLDLDAPELGEPESERELSDPAQSEPEPALKEPEPARPKPVLRRADRLRTTPSRKQVDPVPAEPEPKHAKIAPLGAPQPASDRDAPTRSLRELAERVLAGDDFQVLDITPPTSDREVRTAYERILQEVPEVEPTAANLVHAQHVKRIRSRIKAAFANLRDDERRRAYSLVREEEEQDRKARPSADRALEGERWFRKGKAHLDRKRCVEAVEAFGMASHLDPEQGEYASHLGYALYLSNPNDGVVQREAMEHVACGIKRSPKHELSYVYLGRILKAKGDIDVAKKIFLKALRIKPDFHPAVQELRVIEMRESKGKGLLSRLVGR
ncbi:MAG: response regulator [Myxococcota bacterium]